MKVFIADYSTWLSEIRHIRNEVFCVEQQVSPEEEWDGSDEECIHVLAEGGDDIPRAVGTGRISPGGKIGRLAVLKAFRGQGFGAALILCLLDLAKQKGLSQVYLHAQTQALDFYQSFGFAVEGGTFNEAGIEHIKMVKSIPPVETKPPCP